MSAVILTVERPRNFCANFRFPVYSLTILAAESLKPPSPTTRRLLRQSVLVGRPCRRTFAGSGLESRFLYIPLNSRATVDAASVERTKLCALLRATNLDELPVFTDSDYAKSL